MTKIEIPELLLEPVMFEPREVRGDGGVDEPPGDVLLGGPFWTELPKTYETEEAESSAFRGDSNWRWILGVMALSFHVSHSSERFEKAWLKLDLVRPDEAEPKPVAWSMKPSRIAREVKRSTTLSLGPSFTILDVGIEASVERGTERTIEEVSVDAIGEKTSSPRWVLQRTPSANLVGCTRLVLIVRVPRGARVSSWLDIGYTTARRRALFFWPRTGHQESRHAGMLPEEAIS